MTDHTTTVRAQLRNIPDLYALLPDAATTRTSIEGPRPAPASRPPARLDITDLCDTRTKTRLTDGPATWIDPDRMGALPYLDTWARDLEACAHDGDTHWQTPPRPDPPAPVPDPPTIAGLCAWLDKELDWAATLPQWPDLAHGINHIHHRLRAATRNVRDIETRPVPCQRCGHPLDRAHGTKPLWTCHACGHEVTVQAVTLRQAATILGRPYPTLIAWKNRNLITAVSDGPRQNLYDLGELRRVHAEIRLRGA